MASQRTSEWREKNKDFIQQWRLKMEELRLRSTLERWDQDKFEIEIMQLIDDQILRNVFIFAKNYVIRCKSGNFRKLMVEVYDEIVQYGTIEPNWLNLLNKKITTARRKMWW